MSRPPRSGPVHDAPTTPFFANPSGRRSGALDAVLLTLLALGFTAATAGAADSGGSRPADRRRRPAQPRRSARYARAGSAVLAGSTAHTVLPATLDAVGHLPENRHLVVLPPPVDRRGSRSVETPSRLRPEDVPELLGFLTRADLTVSGLSDPGLRLWLSRDAAGRVQGSAGYELSEDGQHALIRSVAVDASRRHAGLGVRLARYALERAADEGAREAWLFSRYCGAFWRRLGFEPVDCDALARVLGRTHQVQLFESTGQMQEEVAWRRPLAGARPRPLDHVNESWVN